jgi:hypothetical protein
MQDKMNELIDAFNNHCHETFIEPGGFTGLPLVEGRISADIPNQ